LREHSDDETLRVAIVLNASPKAVQLQLASGERVSVSGAGLSWAQKGLDPKARAPLKLQRGSVVHLLATGQNGAGNTWEVAQWPEVQAALVALDTQSGRVRALVGGFDFSRQPFNHVTQSWRQPGSAFKPVLYSAALEERIMPATLVDDLPFTAANGWSPGNSHGEGSGPISLREALTRSSNLASVRVLQTVGTGRTRDWASRFGLDAARQPDNLTLALGSGSVTPLQMARTYATWANGGWRVNPVVVEKITDAQGKVLFEAPPAEPLTEANRAIPERNAFVMNSLLNDVTLRGTAARAQAQLKRNDVYGKTGTTNDAVDAWFVGYHPSLATAVWMGHDTPRSLGDRESGGRLALPIWIDYMGAALRGTPVSPAPEVPAGLAQEGGDWRYSEWANGGWVTDISDQRGVVMAPLLLPTLITSPAETRP
jgi:penicillin-binding protein 1A